MVIRSHISDNKRNQAALWLSARCSHSQWFSSTAEIYDLDTKLHFKYSFALINSPYLAAKMKFDLIFKTLLMNSANEKVKCNLNTVRHTLFKPVSPFTNCKNKHHFLPLSKWNKAHFGFWNSVWFSFSWHVLNDFIADSCAAIYLQCMRIVFKEIGEMGRKLSPIWTDLNLIKSFPCLQQIYTVFARMPHTISPLFLQMFH